MTGEEARIITDASGVIRSVNQAAERALHMTSPALVNQRLSALWARPERYEALVQRAAESESGVRRSVILQLKSGDRLLVDLTLRHEAGASGAGVTHIIHDALPWRPFAEGYVQAERFAVVGRFASQVAHEIRNPLGSISLNVELLQDAIGASGEAGRLLRSVMSELDHVNDIIGNYSQFSRVPKPRVEPWNLGPIVAAAVRAVPVPPGVQLEVDSAFDPTLPLDSSLCRRALENLLRNAIESVHGKGRVQVRTESAPGYAVVRVSDNGTGIEPAVRSRLFEPFVTTKSNGIGLGLSTALQIITEHNGHILVDSTPGQGSTFSVHLPL